MKAWMILGAVSCVALGSCQRNEGARSDSLFGSSARGRYQGVAVYAPGRMWTQVARAGAPSNAAAATLDDDEQVIVVVDTATGELRQCGNLSGFCIAMNPWAKSATPSTAAPAPLTKHARDFEGEGAVREGPVTGAAGHGPK
jgi:hypothetical protein